MSALAVQTHGLSRRFAHHYALRELSLSVPSSSGLLVVGPNGAGKTTLLRLRATALRPSAGQAVIFGHDVVRNADAVRGVTVFVGPAHGMYDALTARENLAFAAAMSGRPGGEESLDALLERVGLVHVSPQTGPHLQPGNETPPRPGAGVAVGATPPPPR
jgi:ABC-2 type transport system ATP-binding protein